MNFNCNADIWAQLVLVCCCFWNYNSYQPGCCYRWTPGPWSRRGYVYGCPTHTLHAKKMARQRKYWEGPHGVWNLISGNADEVHAFVWKSVDQIYLYHPWSLVPPLKNTKISDIHWVKSTPSSKSFHGRLTKMRIPNCMSNRSLHAKGPAPMFQNFLAKLHETDF